MIRMNRIELQIDKVEDFILNPENKDSVFIFINSESANSKRAYCFENSKNEKYILFTEWHGLHPEAIQIQENKFFGFDEQLAIVNANEEVALISVAPLFFRFHFEEKRQMLLAIFETAIVALSSLNGSEIWRFFLQDILTDISFSEESIMIITWEKEKVVLDYFGKARYQTT